MLSGIAHMEQNKLAWVTCHSEATLLGHLCLKTYSFLSYNLLFPQMPSPPTPDLCILVPAPVVRARVLPAFAGLVNCPGTSSFFLSHLGTSQSCFSAGEGGLANRRQPTCLRSAVSDGVKSDTRRLSPARISVPPSSTQPSIWGHTHSWE